MIRFECDYSEGAHPKIIRILSETNFEQTSGYGTDEYCEKARRLIKEICGAPGPMCTSWWEAPRQTGQLSPPYCAPIRVF